MHISLFLDFKLDSPGCMYEGRNYWEGGELMMLGFSVHGSCDNNMLLYTGECALPVHTLYANYE